MKGEHVVKDFGDMMNKFGEYKINKLQKRSKKIKRNEDYFNKKEREYIKKLKILGEKLLLNKKNIDLARKYSISPKTISKLKNIHTLLNVTQSKLCLMT